MNIFDHWGIEIGNAISSSEFPELKDAKQRAIDHFEDCTICRDGELCAEGNALIDTELSVMRDCFRRKRQ